MSRPCHNSPQLRLASVCFSSANLWQYYTWHAAITQAAAQCFSSPLAKSLAQLLLAAHAWFG